jgi:methionyl-tRNA formyltransferase
VSIEDICAACSIPVIASLERLHEVHEPDYLISVQYHRILAPGHIARARKMAVNLHMAPLPEYRGCNQFSFAIVDKATEFGTTLHRLEPGIDSGAIIAERRFPIGAEITVRQLYERTYEESLLLFKEAIPRLLAGNVTLTPQSAFAGTRRASIHYRKDIEKLKQIDLSESPEDIARRIRATSMPGFPPPYAVVGGHRIEFLLREGGGGS